MTDTEPPRTIPICVSVEQVRPCERMADLNGMSVAESLEAAAEGSRPWLPRPCAGLRPASERGRSCVDGPGSFKRLDRLRPAQALQIKPLVATAASNEIRRHFSGASTHRMFMSSSHPSTARPEEAGPADRTLILPLSAVAIRGPAGEARSCPR